MSNFEIDRSVVYNNFTFQLKDQSVKYILEFQEDCTDKIVSHFYQFLLGCGHSEAAIAQCMRETADEWFDLQQSMTQQTSSLDYD